MPEQTPTSASAGEFATSVITCENKRKNRFLGVFLHCAGEEGVLVRQTISLLGGRGLFVIFRVAHPSAERFPNACSHRNISESLEA